VERRALPIPGLRVALLPLKEVFEERYDIFRIVGLRIFKRVACNDLQSRKGVFELRLSRDDFLVKLAAILEARLSGV
jgi:hypothetical protein